MSLNTINSFAFATSSLIDPMATLIDLPVS